MLFIQLGKSRLCRQDPAAWFHRKQVQRVEVGPYEEKVNWQSWICSLSSFWPNISFVLMLFPTILRLSIHPMSPCGHICCTRPWHQWFLSLLRNKLSMAAGFTQSQPSLPWQLSLKILRSESDFTYRSVVRAEFHSYQRKTLQILI